MTDMFGRRTDEGPATDRLFLAVLPDHAARQRLSGLGQTLQREHRLQGRSLRPEHLHITLHHLGDYLNIPQNVVDSASRAVASLVSAPPFAVSLDRVVTFQRPGSKP